MSESAINKELLYFNGINGGSGKYDLPPMTDIELFDFIRGVSLPENLSELRFRYQQSTQQHLGVKDGVNPKELKETGWGVIFAHDADPAIKVALSELLNHRHEQAGDYFKIYEGPGGYRPGESKLSFLARHGAGPGPVDPEKVPYYLLIVGSPDEIPYQFQYQLDVQYAVGRVHFEMLHAYTNYARNVVATEKNAVKSARQVAFFGVSNSDDKATALSTRFLVEPLYEKLSQRKSDWQFSLFTREEATKAQLTQLLIDKQAPVLLFAACHGMSFRMGDNRQLVHQGALLCQDWPGPTRWQGTIPQDFYLAGDDLTKNAKLQSQIAFFFACYGAGTPLHDEFSKQAFRHRQQIAPYPFVARLPMQMLSQERGGALAVIGHVERAWGYSFVWPGAGQQTAVFESTVERLLDDYPVGAAVEFLNERYAELASDLSVKLEEIEFGRQADPYDLSGLWTANNDARGYAIIGDPAVRLCVMSDI